MAIRRVYYLEFFIRFHTKRCCALTAVLLVHVCKQSMKYRNIGRHKCDTHYQKRRSAYGAIWSQAHSQPCHPWLLLVV